MRIHGAEAATTAFLALRRSCNQNFNVTFAEAAREWPEPRGLLFEAFRALYRDIPYLVASTKHCAPQNCKTIVLDDDNSLDDVFFSDIAPLVYPLLMEALDEVGGERRSYDAAFFFDSIRKDFLRSCKTSQHQTTERRFLEILRHLDATILDNALFIANASLTNSNAIHPSLRRSSEESPAASSSSSSSSKQLSRETKLMEKLIFSSIDSAAGHRHHHHRNTKKTPRRHH